MKLLLIAFSWPPSSDTGSQRASRIARYLAELGWDVTAIVSESRAGSEIYRNAPSTVRTIRVPYSSVLERVGKVRTGFRRNGRPHSPSVNGGPVRRSFLRDLLTLPDEAIAWYPAAYRRAAREIQDGGIDVILSSSPPEVTHMVAARLSRRFNIPWVADLRDAWSMDHYRSFPVWKRSILGVIEKNILSQAAAAVTVSHEIAKAETQFLGRPVNVIFNGYDPAEWQAPPEFRKHEDRTIRLVYAGKLDPIHQSPVLFLKGLKLLSDRNPKVRVQADFFLTGYRRPDVVQLAEREGLDSSHIRVLQPLPNDELPHTLSTYDALLLFPWQGPAWEGYVSLKVFDYLGACRPILAVGEHISGSLSQVLRETALGTELNSAEAIAEFFDKKADMLRQDQWSHNADRRKAYSCQEHARTFSELFHSVVKVTNR